MGLIADLLRESALRSILNISEQMFHSDFLGLSRSNRGGYMDELAAEISILINLFLSEISRRWKTDLLSLLHPADNINWQSVVSTEDLIDLNIVLFRLRAGRIPSNNLLFSIDSSHHVEHFLVVDVVEEPDIRLCQILLKRHRVTVCDLKFAFVTVFAE